MDERLHRRKDSCSYLSNQTVAKKSEKKITIQAEVKGSNPIQAQIFSHFLPQSGCVDNHEHLFFYIIIMRLLFCKDGEEKPRCKELLKTSVFKVLQSPMDNSLAVEWATLYIK